MKNFLDEKIEKLDALQKTAAETYLEWKKSEREWDEKMRREIVSFRRRWGLGLRSGMK